MTPDASVLRSKDVGVAPERHHPFLDPGAARVVQTHDRGAHLDGQIHDLDDLGGVRFRQRAAEHGEVLGERVHRLAIGQPVYGDDSVTGHELVGPAEILTPVRDQLVSLFERAGVEEVLHALTGGELASGMLPPLSLLAAARFSASFELRQGLTRVHGSSATPAPLGPAPNRPETA